MPWETDLTGCRIVADITMRDTVTWTSAQGINILTPNTLDTLIPALALQTIRNKSITKLTKPTLHEGNILIPSYSNIGTTLTIVVSALTDTKRSTRWAKPWLQIKTLQTLLTYRVICIVIDTTVWSCGLAQGDCGQGQDAEYSQHYYNGKGGGCWGLWGWDRGDGGGWGWGSFMLSMDVNDIHVDVCLSSLCLCV